MFRMMFSPAEIRGDLLMRCMSPKPHHHPLLSDFSEVQPFPSSSAAKKIFRELCGKRHSGHDSSAPSQCFMHYASVCSRDGYSAQIPGTDRLPFDKTILPDKYPILEHINLTLISQRKYHGGGSFKKFIQRTLMNCMNSRQVTDKTVPEVRTVIFGKSTKSEVKEFVRSFNSVMDNYRSPDFGHLPFEFFSFDVESVSCLADTAPVGVRKVHGMETIVQLGTHGSSVPARIHFGFWDHRWDIVIPWSCSTLEDFRGDFKLELPSTPLDDLWHDIFKNLHGYAIGIGLEQDVLDLNKFLEKAYTFRNRTGPVMLKTFDLTVLLAIAGYNSPHTNITALNFFFTGGLIQKQYQIRMGLGQWAEVGPLPQCLNLYLTSEHLGVMNTAVLASCAWFLHLFATPGVGALASRKEPPVLLVWFAQFQVAILHHASLPKQSRFNNGDDRVLDPKALIRQIEYSVDDAPFTPEDVAAMIPSWASVTQGGADTDQQVLDHLVVNVIPRLRGPRVPPHLRWLADPVFVDGALTGRTSPSSFLGHISEKCGRDKSVLKLPDFMGKPGKESRTLSEGCATYLAGLSADSPLKALSCHQMMALYVWRYPKKAIQFYACTYYSEKVRMPQTFFAQDLDIVKPLISAFFGSFLEDPPSYSKFKETRYDARSRKRYLFHTAVLSTGNEKERKRAKRLLAKIPLRCKTPGPSAPDIDQDKEAELQAAQDPLAAGCELLDVSDDDPSDMTDLLVAETLLDADDDFVLETEAPYLSAEEIMNSSTF